MYLEPIFTYEDISKSLSEENKKFQLVLQKWVHSMSWVEKNKKVLDLSNNERLLDDLKQMYVLIEDIQKALEYHLEAKRIDFPRFFFLSNDDLISVLAETREPSNIQ